MCNKRTNWRLFQGNIEENLNLNMSLKTEDETEGAIEHLNKIIQESVRMARNSGNKRSKKKKQINYPLEIREKQKEKRRLRKTWQRTLYPLDILAFNRASKELKILIAKNKNETLQNYLHKVIIFIIHHMEGNKTSQKAQNIYFTNKNHLYHMGQDQF